MMYTKSCSLVSKFRCAQMAKYALKFYLILSDGHNFGPLWNNVDNLIGKSPYDIQY